MLDKKVLDCMPVVEASHEGEVELRELLISIWSQRWLVLVLTFFGFFSAVIYICYAPEKYTSQTVLSAPPITNFAPFVRGMQIRSKSEKNALGAALELGKL